MAFLLDFLVRPLRAIKRRTPWRRPLKDVTEPINASVESIRQLITQPNSLVEWNPDIYQVGMNRAHLDPDWPGPTPALPIILPGETAYFAMSTADGIEDVALRVAANGLTVEIIASRPGYGSLIRTYTLARHPADRTTTLTYTEKIVGIPTLFSRSFDDRQKAASTIAEALKLRAELVTDSIFSTFDTDFFVDPPWKRLHSITHGNSGSYGLCRPARRRQELAHAARTYLNQRPRWHRPLVPGSVGLRGV